VEIQTAPQVAEIAPETAVLDLGNGILIHQADLVRLPDNQLLLTVTWQAQQAGLADYSIAVHLVSQDPPAGPQDILAQADSSHPVYGWYPTSRWQPGELVTDHFLLAVPEGAVPQAMRVGMYQSLPDGAFQNTEWLSLPVPERPLSHSQ